MFLSARLTPPVKLTRSLFAFLLAAVLAATSAVAAVPSLDELAADWMSVADLRNYPSVNNFHGALRVEANLLGVNLATWAPYSQGGDTAVLSLNGSPVNAQQSRWFPYQAARQADAA